MAVKNKQAIAVELLLMFGSELALQDWVSLYRNKSWTSRFDKNELSPFL